MRKENDDVCKGNISGPEEGGGVTYIPKNDLYSLPTKMNKMNN